MATHFSNYKFDSPAIHGKTTLKLLLTHHLLHMHQLQYRGTNMHDQFKNLTATVCNKQGKWDPDPAEFCATALSNQSTKLLKLVFCS